jgi:voltage-gated potassium channel
MALTLDFLTNLIALLGYLAPLFIGLGLIIAGLSVAVGRTEKWSITDSLYFGFITALTVGYGDLRPTRGMTKFLAILLALTGLITSGILVAVSLEAVKLSLPQQAGV